MIKCQACGTQNLDSSQFCDECGDSLQKYKAPGGSKPVESVANEGESKAQPIFQSASVTSVGIPLVAENAAKREKPDTDISNEDEPESEGAKSRNEHANLVIERGGAIGTEFSLASDESNLGRWDADNGIFPDVDLDSHDPEAKVSRKHARIVFRGEKYFLEDLGSTNGTFVNRGRRLIPGSPHQIKEGDEIIVGKTFLRFHIN